MERIYHEAVDKRSRAVSNCLASSADPDGTSRARDRLQRGPFAAPYVDIGKPEPMINSRASLVPVVVVAPDPRR